MIEFNDILVRGGLDPAKVVVIRHQPTELALRKRLRWLAAEDQEAFMAYQATQKERTESALKRASHMASFVADGRGRALLVGIYELTSSELVSEKKWLENKAIAELVDLGSVAGQGRDEVLWFHQKRVEVGKSFYGRLVIDWPGLERSWWRWADRNTFKIVTIHEEDALIERLESWDTIVFNWSELRRLPRRYQQRLKDWRGIYFIRDKSDGSSYVGSAYGIDNILGRWLNYAQTGHGNNKLLRNRDPSNFQFSILQIVSPDMVADEVIKIENSWKVRLGSRAADGGLNDN